MAAKIKNIFFYLSMYMSSNYYHVNYQLYCTHFLWHTVCKLSIQDGHQILKMAYENKCVKHIWRRKTMFLIVWSMLISSDKYYICICRAVHVNDSFWQLHALANYFLQPHFAISWQAGLMFEIDIHLDKSLLCFFTIRDHKDQEHLFQ